MTLLRGELETTAVRLSICIATRNRAAFIGETLDSILGQIESGVEVVVVDGASTDETPQLLASYCSRYPQVRYFREESNGGVDADYDKAVGYAVGQYCWLMTDDDLLLSGAIARVLQAIEQAPDVIVVDAEVRTIDFAKSLGRRLPTLPPERVYLGIEGDVLFRDVATHLTFIGAVILRRAWWLARDRQPYYGSLFIHVGVIFQHPAPDKAIVIAEPLIVIRYGNAMWTPRSFEIWAFKWPELVWSFTRYSEAARETVSPRDPWRRIKTLLFHRAMGGYSMTEYRRYLASRVSLMERIQALTVALIPGQISNAIVTAYLGARSRKPSAELHDLVASRYATRLTRFIANRTGL
jgi:glycosyltransferase involved in cell wall biosynthesis